MCANLFSIADNTMLQTGDSIKIKRFVLITGSGDVKSRGSHLVMVFLLGDFHMCKTSHGKRQGAQVYACLSDLFLFLITPRFNGRVSFLMPLSNPLTSPKSHL